MWTCDDACLTVRVHVNAYSVREVACYFVSRNASAVAPMATVWWIPSSYGRARSLRPPIIRAVACFRSAAAAAAATAAIEHVSSLFRGSERSFLVPCSVDHRATPLTLPVQRQRSSITFHRSVAASVGKTEPMPNAGSCR